jgi:hypothetical protein
MTRTAAAQVHDVADEADSRAHPGLRDAPVVSPLRASGLSLNPPVK